MIDPFLLLAPILLLAIVALLGFVGCHFVPGQASPDPPSGLKAVAGDSWVQLTWDAYTESTPTDFLVVRTGGGSTKTIDTMSTTNCYVDSTVTDGTSYSYAVQVVVTGGAASENSSSVSATPAAITYVQLAEIDVQAANTTTATSNPFPSPLTSGNLIVVWVWYNTGGNTTHVAQITDTVGNQYSQIVPRTAGANTLAGFAQEIWIAKQIAGGSGVTITATMIANTTVTELAVSGHEYTGANNFVMGTAAAMIGTSASAAVGPVATTAGPNTLAAKLVFAAAIYSSGTGAAGGGFTQRSKLQRNVTEDQPITTPGTCTTAGASMATFTSTATNPDWIAQMVAFG